MTSNNTAASVETLEDVSAFASLAGEWAALLAASDEDGLFLTWEWLFAWWKHLSAGCELHIVLVRKAGELIAVAPLALRYGSARVIPPVAVLQFLGSGVAGSDHLDLIVRRGHEEEAVRLVSECLVAAGRVVALMRMRSDGPAAALVVGMRRRGWRAWRGPQESCPFVSLRGESFETYMASLGAEHRYAFRRKVARLERRGELRFDLARTDTERRESLATLFALHELRWHARGDEGAFSTQALRDFHEDFSRMALTAGWLRLWVLRLDGKPAAAVYGFLRRRTFYFYQSGFDPAFARDSVGLVALGMAVRSAMDDGADELDLLHGTERYKAHWANSTRELERVELYAPGAAGLLKHEATAITREARRVSRIVFELGRRAVAKTTLVVHARSR